jgi:uncharacterized membrane protein
MTLMYVLAIIFVICGWITKDSEYLFYSLIVLLIGSLPAVIVGVYNGNIKILPE